MEKTSEHIVRNLPLAAFLKLRGHRIIRFEPIPRKGFCNFVFERDATIGPDRC